MLYSVNREWGRQIVEFNLCFDTQVKTIRFNILSRYLRHGEKGWTSSYTTTAEFAVCHIPAYYFQAVHHFLFHFILNDCNFLNFFPILLQQYFLRFWDFLATFFSTRFSKYKLCMH